MNTQAIPIIELPAYLASGSSYLSSITAGITLVLSLILIFLFFNKRLKTTYRLFKLLIALNNKSESERLVAYDLCHIGRDIISSKKFLLSNNEFVLLQQLKYNNIKKEDPEKLKKLLKRITVFSLIRFY